MLVFLFDRPAERIPPLTFLHDLAARAALAIDNSTLYEQRRQEVVRMQQHLLPTRLDAARRLGGVLAAAAAGLALTEAGLGQDPAGDLVPIDPSWLSARLLRAAKGDA